MKNFLMIILVSLLLTSALSLMGQLLPTHSPDPKKSSPYECGFDPINSPRLPFSFRFFLVAILFILFDLEMALLLPLPGGLLLKNLLPGVFTLIFFLSILTSGLYFEWVKGGLDWAKE